MPGDDLRRIATEQAWSLFLFAGSGSAKRPYGLRNTSNATASTSKRERDQNLGSLVSERTSWSNGPASMGGGLSHGGSGNQGSQTALIGLQSRNDFGRAPSLGAMTGASLMSPFGNNVHGGKIICGILLALCSLLNGHEAFDTATLTGQTQDLPFLQRVPTNCLKEAHMTEVLLGIFHTLPFPRYCSKVSFASQSSCDRSDTETHTGNLSSR